MPFPFLRGHAVGIFSDFRLIENEMNVFVKSVVESGELKIRWLMITDVKINKVKSRLLSQGIPKDGESRDYHDDLGFIVSLGLTPLMWLKPEVYENEAQNRFFY